MVHRLRRQLLFILLGFCRVRVGVLGGKTLAYRVLASHPFADIDIRTLEKYIRYSRPPHLISLLASLLVRDTYYDIYRIA